MYVEGQLETRKWQDQSGNDRYSTEVVLKGYNATMTMLDSRADNAALSSSQNNYSSDYGSTNSDTGTSNSGQSEGIGDLDDEIPF